MTELEKVLKERGIKKGWLAVQVGVRPATVTTWMHGTLPKDETKVKVANLLDLSVELLFFGPTVDPEVYTQERESA